MITSTHVIIYAEDADKARTFFRDVLELPNVDAHGGWLIFKLPPSELGIHPAEESGDSSNASSAGHHELYLMCDEIEETVAALVAKGVEFITPIEDQRFGRLAKLRVPGAGPIGIYEPKHAVAYDL